MRNLNVPTGIIFFRLYRSWLSSNEEFESLRQGAYLDLWLDLIIFQWGIWISLSIFFSLFFWYPWLSSNEEFECPRPDNKETAGALDYLPMRNLNLCFDYLTFSDSQTWLSSNEEFELDTCTGLTFSEIAWLSSNEEFEFGMWTQTVIRLLLDYLPMRNLNLLFEYPTFSDSHLIIFQWGIWIFKLDFQNPVRLYTWLSSNEEFEYAKFISLEFLTGRLIIFQWGIWISSPIWHPSLNLLLDYLPMRNLNYIRSIARSTSSFTWLSSNEEFE